MSLPQVAKDLDLTESALRNRVREADGDKGMEPAGALSTAERKESASHRGLSGLG
ncbi:hypothetical protein [Vitiosangium sp. GDMCC 1.1324]|uniref:hypothetical protein n=1 Tax=Vitiosangium sp. (strain GDMCC 1.1324) TaxID=2138576 RepID=UPI00130DD59B